MQGRKNRSLAKPRRREEAKGGCLLSDFATWRLCVSCLRNSEELLTPSPPRPHVPSHHRMLSTDKVAGIHVAKPQEMGENHGLFLCRASAPMRGETRNYTDGHKLWRRSPTDNCSVDLRSTTGVKDRRLELIRFYRKGVARRPECLCYWWNSHSWLFSQIRLAGCSRNVETPDGGERPPLQPNAPALMPLRIRTEKFERSSYGEVRLFLRRR